MPSKEIIETQKKWIKLANFLKQKGKTKPFIVDEPVLRCSEIRAIKALYFVQKTMCCDDPFN